MTHISFDDAFKQYCYDHSTDNLIFLPSGPPLPIFLIWQSSMNKNFERKSQTSITLLLPNTENVEHLEYYKNIWKYLKDKNVPFVGISYDEDFKTMKINRKEYDIDNGRAANKLSDLLDMPLRSTSSKSMNKKDSEADKFHIWSRNVFDGCCISKIDVDMFVLKNKTPHAFVEIKRSDKRTLDDWYPFDDDLTGYLNQLTFSKKTGLNFFTVHHRNKHKEFSDNDMINVFNFSPGEGTDKSISFSKMVLSKRQIRADEFINIFT